jgi:hypothetical protein
LVGKQSNPCATRLFILEIGSLPRPAGTMILLSLVSFPIWVLIISFSCLLLRVWVLCYIRVERANTLVSVLILGEMLSVFFPFMTILTIVLSYRLYYVEVCCFYS